MSEPILDAETMAELIAFNASSFVDTCVLSGTRDGEPFEVQSVCRLDPNTAQRDESGALVVIRGQVKLAFPLTTDIQSGDTVDFGGALLDVDSVPLVGAFDVELAVILKRGS